MSVNDSHYCACLTLSDLPAADRATLGNSKAAVLKNARWQTGSVISARFLDGSKALQDRVMKVAKEWEAVANLHLQFVQAGPTDIRIAFAEGKGSWSYLGIMCRSIPEPQPTMNYGWLTPTSDDAELRRVVLHEFGHAIGLIHEHQNPDGGIKWNKPAVQHDLGGPPNNWNPATIESNMFKHYAPREVVGSKTDKDSIMMYPIPKAWTLDGFSAGLNGALSEQDRALVKQVYPR
jgi:serralysin